MDTNALQQSVILVSWMALAALAIAVVSIVMAWSAKKAHSQSKDMLSDFQSKSQTVVDIESKTDRAIKDRVSEIMRSAFGQPDSPSAFATALLSHSQFRDHMVAALSEQLSDPGDRLSEKLAEELGKVADTLFSEPAIREKIRTSVSDFMVERTPELLSDDEEISEKVAEAVSENLPALIKELMTSNEDFRKKVMDALIEKMTEVFENSY